MAVPPNAGGASVKYQGEDWCFLLEAVEAEEKVFEVRASNTSQQLWLDSA